MSTAKTVTAIATVVALLAVGSAVYQAAAHHESTAALSAVSQERDDLRTRVALVEKKLQRTQQDFTAAQSARPDVSSAAVKVPDAKAPLSPAVQNSTPLDYILEHPETHGAYVQQQLLRSKVLHDRFFLGLSPEKQEVFLQHGRAVAEFSLDLMAAIRSQGYGANGQPPDPQFAQQLRTMAKQTADSLDEKFKQALGDDLHRQYLEYAKTIPERTVLGQLGGQLYYQDVALTRDQGDQLIRILSANRYSSQNPVAGVAIPAQVFAAARMQAGQQGAPIDWMPITDAALAQAQAVLTPAQMAALRQVQAQQVTQIQLAPPRAGPPAATAPNPTK